MKKKYFIYPIISLAAFAIFGAAYATADTAMGANNPMSELVNAIAQKFNLNASDVQQIFDEQRVKMEAQREQRGEEMKEKFQQKFTERINQAVSDGKLTQEQANLIFAKRAEIEAQQKNMENMTKEERQTAAKEQRDSLRQWAEDNNIPQEYLMFGGFGMGKGNGRQGGQGFGGMGGDCPENVAGGN